MKNKLTKSCGYLCPCNRMVKASKLIRIRLFLLASGYISSREQKI